MTSTYPGRDRPGHIENWSASSGARSRTGAAAFGIASVSCAGGAAFGAIIARLGLPVPGVALVPAGGMLAVAFGIASLARRERPRSLAITGLVAGALALLATVLVIAFLIFILASWGASS